jgi:hypothetical protein
MRAFNLDAATDTANGTLHTPELDTWGGVLRQVRVDLEHGGRARDLARAYVDSDEFAQLCDELGLNPGYMRRKMDEHDAGSDTTTTTKTTATGTCEHCGQPAGQYHGRTKRFCSNRCASKAWSKAKHANGPRAQASKTPTKVTVTTTATTAPVQVCLPSQSPDVLSLLDAIEVLRGWVPQPAIDAMLSTWRSAR